MQQRCCVHWNSKTNIHGQPFVKETTYPKLVTNETGEEAVQFVWQLAQARAHEAPRFMAHQVTCVGVPLDPYAEYGLRFIFCRVVGGTDDARNVVPDGW